eukprot:416398_1
MLRSLSHITKALHITPGTVRIFSRMNYSDNNSIQYDENIAEQYKKLKHEFKYFFSSFSWTSVQLLNKLKQQQGIDNNLSIIDIACGDGNASRYITDNTNFNNVRVLGIDKSKPQIDVSKESTPETIYPFIQYEVGLAEDLYTDKYNHLHNSFDIALLNWCFNYATTIDAFNDMMRSVYKILKPNGFAMGLTVTCEDGNMLKEIYGDKELNEFNFIFYDFCDKKDGDIVGYQMGSMPFDTYYYSPNTYKSVAQKHGFKQFSFLDEKYECIANPELNEYEMKLWNAFISNPNASKMFYITK